MTEQSAADVEKAVVAAYRQGAKLTDIEKEYGLARATVYWILERNGVAPDRAHRRSRLLDEASAATLLELIEHQNRRILEADRAREAFKAAVNDVDIHAVEVIEKLLAENEQLRTLLDWWRTKHPRTKDPDQLGA